MEDPTEYKIMTENMGEELAKIIQKTKDDEFLCDECGEVHKCVNWRSHDIYDSDENASGFADKTGKKWWIYIYWERGIYQWSHYKIQNRLITK